MGWTIAVDLELAVMSLSRSKTKRPMPLLRAAPLACHSTAPHPPCPTHHATPPLGEGGDHAVAQSCSPCHPSVGRGGAGLRTATQQGRGGQVEAAREGEGKVGTGGEGVTNMALFMLFRVILVIV